MTQDVYRKPKVCWVAAIGPRRGNASHQTSYVLWQPKHVEDTADATKDTAMILRSTTWCQLSVQCCPKVSHNENAAALRLRRTHLHLFHLQKTERAPKLLSFWCWLALSPVTLNSEPESKPRHSKLQQRMQNRRTCVKTRRFHLQSNKEWRRLWRTLCTLKAAWCCIDGQTSNGRLSKAWSLVWDCNGQGGTVSTQSCICLLFVQLMVRWLLFASQCLQTMSKLELLQQPIYAARRGMHAQSNRSHHIENGGCSRTLRCWCCWFCSRQCIFSFHLECACKRNEQERRRSTAQTLMLPRCCRACASLCATWNRRGLRRPQNTVASPLAATITRPQIRHRLNPHKSDAICKATREAPSERGARLRCHKWHCCHEIILLRDKSLSCRNLLKGS